MDRNVGAKRARPGLFREEAAFKGFVSKALAHCNYLRPEHFEGSRIELFVSVFERSAAPAFLFTVPLFRIFTRSARASLYEKSASSRIRVPPKESSTRKMDEVLEAPEAKKGR